MSALTASNAVSTIAELRALAVPAPADVRCYLVLGHTTAGDGGGGVFYWDDVASDADDDGITIRPGSSPAQGRWLRSFAGPVHVGWWGLLGNGSDETAKLRAAFDAAAGRGIVFDEARSYGFSSAQAMLVVPDDTTIVNNGAELRLLATSTSSNPSLFLGRGVTANLLKIVVATTGARRVVMLDDDCDLERVEISATSFQEPASALDGALQIRGDRSAVGYARISGFAYAAVVYGAQHVLIRRLEIDNFRRGLYTSTSGHVTVLAGALSNGSGSDSGFVFTATDDVSVSNVTIKNPGSYGITVTGSTPVSRYSLSSIHVWQPGGGGVLFAPTGRASRIQINGLTVVDCAYTSTVSTGEDGLRLENCSYVTVDGFQLTREAKSSSAHDGIYVGNCDFVTINAPTIRDAASNGIYLDGRSGLVNQIAINNAVVIGSGRQPSAGAGGHGILIDSPANNLRDVTIRGCYIRNQGNEEVGSPLTGYGIRVVTTSTGAPQPVILQGYVKNDGLGAVSFSTSSPDTDIRNFITTLP